jgi:predicted alpha/beta-hydrolase family hydrolase
VEHAARFEEVRIQLPEPLDGVDALSAVVGIPEWWPTGARVAVALAHGADGDLDDPLVEALHRDLASRKYLTIRFNFPFAEAGRSAEDEGPEVLERAYRAALSVLGRDPTAAPSHLFLGGTGLGASVAAQLATARLQIDGVFFLGFPLHPADRPEEIHADTLFRIIPSMFFVQGSEDPTCDLGALRRVLSRVGAPTALRIVEGADASLVPPGLSDEEAEASRRAVAGSLAQWMEKVMGGDG